MDFDFSANQTIDNDEALANVPETYRGAYAKGADGKYAIADTHKPFVDTIVGLRGALSNERKSSKELKGQKDAVAVIKETFGFDTIEEAKAKYDELNKAVAEGAKVDPAKIKADIQASFDKVIATKDGELKGMTATLEKYLVKGAAATAIAAEKGNAVLLEPHISRLTKVVKDGDEYVVRVLDAAGDYRGDGKGGFMGVEDLVKELKADKTFAGAFESDALGGAEDRQGRRPSDAQRQQRSTSTEDMSGTDMIAKGLEAQRRQRR